MNEAFSLQMKNNEGRNFVDPREHVLKAVRKLRQKPAKKEVSKKPRNILQILAFVSL